MKNLIIVALIMFIGIYAFGQPGNRKAHNKASKKIEAQKIAYITNTLDLTPEEAAKFWPLYNEYSKKMRELRPLAKPKIKKLSQEEADKLIDDYFANEQKKFILKKNYYEKFRAVLPPVKVVKLLFAERKFKLKLLKRLKERRRSKFRN